MLLAAVYHGVLCLVAVLVAIVTTPLFLAALARERWW